MTIQSMHQPILYFFSQKVWTQQAILMTNIILLPCCDAHVRKEKYQRHFTQEQFVYITMEPQGYFGFTPGGAGAHYVYIDNVPNRWQPPGGDGGGGVEVVVVLLLLLLLL
jgi:hypothetical protein